MFIFTTYYEFLSTEKWHVSGNKIMCIKSRTYPGPVESISDQSRAYPGPTGTNFLAHESGESLRIGWLGERGFGMTRNDVLMMKYECIFKLILNGD